MTKPPTRYGAQVKLKAAEQEATAAPAASAAGLDNGPATRNRPMETKSDPTIVYLHPDGKYELKRYALAKGPKVKVHDILIEAIEEWAERHGIASQFRVPSQRPRRVL